MNVAYLRLLQGYETVAMRLIERGRRERCGLARTTSVGARKYIFACLSVWRASLGFYSFATHNVNVGMSRARPFDATATGTAPASDHHVLEIVQYHLALSY